MAHFALPLLWFLCRSALLTHSLRRLMKQKWENIRTKDEMRHGRDREVRKMAREEGTAAGRALPLFWAGRSVSPSFVCPAVRSSVQPRGREVGSSSEKKVIHS